MRKGAITVSETVLTKPVLEALGDGPDLTGNQQRLLAVLLNPNSPHAYGAETVEDMLDEWASFGPRGSAFPWGEDYADNYEVWTVANYLGDHYETDDTMPDFSFDFTCDSEGLVNGYTTAVYLGHSHGAYLSQWHDAKYLGRTPYSGLRGALYVAESLDGDWRRTVATARALRLIPRSVWPETDAERAAFADWQYEVANGDTCASFRDWYDAKEDAAEAA